MPKTFHVGTMPESESSHAVVAFCERCGYKSGPVDPAFAVTLAMKHVCRDLERRAPVLGED